MCAHGCRATAALCASLPLFGALVVPAWADDRCFHAAEAEHSVLWGRMIRGDSGQGWGFAHTLMREDGT